jgi:hypothetical protein
MRTADGTERSVKIGDPTTTKRGFSRIGTAFGVKHASYSHWTCSEGLRRSRYRNLFRRSPAAKLKRSPSEPGDSSVDRVRFCIDAPAVAPAEHAKRQRLYRSCSTPDTRSGTRGRWQPSGWGGVGWRDERSDCPDNILDIAFESAHDVR